MVLFDHGDGALGSQDAPQHGQGPPGVRQVLQDEADVDVVEVRGGEGEVEQVGVVPLHVRPRCVVRDTGAGL